MLATRLQSVGTHSVLGNLHSSERAVLMSVRFCVFCLTRAVFKVHRGPAQDGRLVLYDFDCCSESRHVETGFRAIITIRKAQAHGDHRTSVIGVLQSYWLRAACIACPRCVCALHQVWLHKMYSLLKTPTAESIHVSCDCPSGIVSITYSQNNEVGTSLYRGKNCH